VLKLLATYCRFVRFELLRIVLLNIQIFWDVILYH